MYSQRPATSRAARALIEDPARSDQLIAAEANCSSTTIASIRHRLESLAIIPVIPVSNRTAQPRPAQPPGPTAIAIAQLGPQATPRAIADAAGVSMQAAWKAWRKLNPPLADAAGAADALTVAKMPRMLDELAAAADAISVVATITCDCGTQFHVSTADAAARRRRFCSDACRDADSRALGHKLRPRLADGPRHAPQIPDFPEPPDFGKGLCTHVPASQARWWTSADPFLREAAARICEVCPILEPCAAWSLCLPVTDNAIWGAMSQAERLRRKREDRRLAALPKPSPIRWR